MQTEQTKPFVWDAKLWSTLYIVSIVLFMDALDASIVNVALPSIQQSLNLSNSDLTWVQGAYVLAYAGFLLLGGRASDQLGRRRVLLAGMVVFGCASLLGGFAQVVWLLILSRIVQGIGAAFTVPAAISIVTTAFPEGPARNKALGIFGAIISGGFSFGLVCGGLLTGLLNWHWVFFINVIIMVPLFICALLIVRRDEAVRMQRSSDVPGAITGTAFILVLVYTITQANDQEATVVKTAILGLLSLCLLIVFLVIEQRASTPLLPLRLFRLPTLRAANLVSLTNLGCMFGFMFIATLYMQDIAHYTPIKSGLALVPMSLLSVVVSQTIPARIAARFGVRIAVAIGMFMVVVGVLVFSRIGPVADYLGVILPGSVIIGGLGMGIGYSALSMAAVMGVPNEEQGLAASIQSTALQLGGGLGLAIIVAVINAATHANASHVTDQAAELQGFRAGLYLIIAFALLGALIALTGMRERSRKIVSAPSSDMAEVLQTSQLDARS
jgi:EmrB/QacA subfamily drug resistance transporter